ncbi:hypothetical protein BG003_009918 [Podila horticola]|nr:hypothetical protein BG003_009918 [Podila horticola]
MLVVPWDCSKLKSLEIMGASPMCYLKDDWDDEGYHEYDSSDEQSNEQDASNDQDASDNQDNQSSISEETTQGMDVDTDSQWTFDVVMKDGEFNDDQKDDVKLDEYEVYDSFMEIDPTPTELAFDLVLELIDIDCTSKFLGALAGWLAILGWSLQTDMEPFELAIKRNYKRFLVNLFERVSEMPNIDRVTMRGLNAIKAC